MECQLDGRPIFECVQATWNLTETSAGVALRMAHESGLGVIVKEALANGRLTVKNDDQAFAPRRALLEPAAKELGTSLDAFCLGAVLVHPWVDLVLSGAATPEQLTSNIKALNISWDPSLDEKLASLREPPEDYWAKRSTLPWT
jgi:aryl-alcohol dehydrogenase-like predicted oxidoreductase